MQEAGVEVDPLGDLNTESERKLGQLVHEKYVMFSKLILLPCTSTHTHTHTHVYIYLCVCVCVCLYTYICVCVCIQSRMMDG